MRMIQVRGQLFVFCMQLYLLLTDSVWSPKWVLDFAAGDGMQAVGQLVYINTLFVSAAVFTVVFKELKPQYLNNHPI